MKKQEEILFVESLYDEYSLSIKSMAKYILKNEKNAEKALRRTFFKVVKYRNLFFDDDKADTRKLMVIFARSSCFNILRKEKGMKLPSEAQVPEHLLSGGSDKGSDLSLLFKEENLAWFRDTFSSLGSPFKEICVLKFYYKLKTSVVADVLGLKQSELNAVLCKYLAKLKIETDHYLKCPVALAELGLAIGLTGIQWAGGYADKLESYVITKVALLPKTKKMVLNYLFIKQYQLWALLGLSALLCLAAILIMVLAF